MGMLFAVPLTGIIKVSSSQVIWGIKNYELRHPARVEENILKKNKQ
jgi:hypothetical protein